MAGEFKKEWGHSPDFSRRKRGSLPILLAFLLAWMAACGSDKPSPPPAVPAVAIVNGQSIDRKEFERAMGEETALAKREKPLKREETESVKEEILDNLIREKIMLQRARELSLSVGEEELAARMEEIRKDYNDQFDTLFNESGIRLADWKEALRKRMLFEKLISVEVNAKIQVTDEEAEQYYKSHRKAYATDRRVQVAQIVLPDRERAERVLNRLKAGEDFGKVAREVSIGPEAPRGGDLGFFERGVMPEAIDRMVFSLPVGKVSRVAQSPYGFHIFKVLGQAEAGGRKFADAKEKVVADLRKQKEGEGHRIWIEGLKAKAAIRINRPLPEPEGADSSAGQEKR